MQIGKYKSKHCKSENTSRTNTNRKTQLETYTSEKQIEATTTRKMQLGKYTPEDITRKIYIGKHKSKIIKIQIGKYKSEIVKGSTIRKIENRKRQLGNTNRGITHRKMKKM